MNSHFIKASTWQPTQLFSECESSQPKYCQISWIKALNLWLKSYETIYIYLLNDVLTALTESLVKHILCLNLTDLFWITFVSWTNRIKIKFKNKLNGASLVAQWLGVCLPMQGTRVRALVWEDPTCRGATKPVTHNYWACASGACAPQRERPR